MLSRHALAAVARTVALARHASTVPAPGRTNSLLRSTVVDGEERKASTPEAIWARNSDHSVRTLVEPPTPYSGRTVEVANGNIAHAYQTLRNVLSRNNVQLELRQTARHEKKGYKRRRLRSERWRRLFADQVRKKVQLVQSIVRRGA